ncbi:hypothetical protein AAA609_08865 [Pseudomonas aeruginosa]|uniref:hypothetical protein n=1 Tax=Pseudomonas aeruginosa TaxID=287 RepID=UPI0021E187A0|nr:hypothetical protein [Pseudomonas aeruginosa]
MATRCCCSAVPATERTRQASKPKRRNRNPRERSQHSPPATSQAAHALAKPLPLAALLLIASHVQAAPAILGDEEKDAIIDRHRLTPELRINRQAKVRHHEGTIDRVVLLQDRDRFTYRSYLRDDQKEPATFWILEFDARSGKRLSERQTDEDDYWRRRDADSQRADSGERNR